MPLDLKERMGLPFLQQQVKQLMLQQQIMPNHYQAFPTRGPPAITSGMGLVVNTLNTLLFVEQVLEYIM